MLITQMLKKTKITLDSIAIGIESRIEFIQNKWKIELIVNFKYIFIVKTLDFL